jgi:hypothetical protein
MASAVSGQWDSKHVMDKDMWLQAHYVGSVQAFARDVDNIIWKGRGGLTLGGVPAFVTQSWYLGVIRFRFWPY